MHECVYMYTHKHIYMYIYIDTYMVNSISFKKFFVQVFKIVIDSGKFSML